MSQQGSGNLLDLFEEPTEESLTVEERADVDRGRQAFSELEKLVKNLSLYGPGHPGAARFRTRFHEAVGLLVTERQEVELRVGPFDLFLHDQSIYRNQNPERNFVYKFYQDGLRSLSFVEGVEGAELDALVDLLLTDWDDPSLFEDDAITLLWQQDFHYILHDVVEGTGDTGAADGAARYTVEGVIDQVRKGAHKTTAAAPDARVEGASAPAPDGDAFDFVGDLDATSSTGRQRVVLAGAQFSQDDVDAMEEHPFAMDEQEFQTLRAFYDDTTRETLTKFIEILFKVCVHEEELQERSRIMDLFERIALVLLRAGRLEELERVMLKVRGLTGPAGELVPENIEAIHHIFERWSQAEFVDRLMVHYNDPEQPRPQVVLETLQLLNPSAALQVARALGAVTISDRRAALVQRLPHLMPGQVKEIGRLLSRVDPAHAHDLLRVLRAVDDPEVQGAINAALNNPDPTVRLEALAAIPVDRAHVYLRFVLNALNDANKIVRNKALHLLARMPGQQVHAHLMQKIRDKDFPDLDLDEKRRYFAGAALTGDPTAQFMEMLQARSLFGRGAADELRACAAVGLAIRLHRPAVPVLQREAKRRIGADVMRDSAAWALQHMACAREARTRQLYDIFFMGELTTGGAA